MQIWEMHNGAKNLLLKNKINVYELTLTDTYINIFIVASSYKQWKHWKAKCWNLHVIAPHKNQVLTNANVPTAGARRWRRQCLQPCLRHQQSLQHGLWTADSTRWRLWSLLRLSVHTNTQVTHNHHVTRVWGYLWRALQIHVSSTATIIYHVNPGLSQFLSSTCFRWEPLQISGTGFLRVICSYAFHLVSSTQSKHWSKLKALTPTRGLASSSLHSPLTPEEPGVAAFMWAPWRQSLSTGTEVMVHA